MSAPSFWSWSYDPETVGLSRIDTAILRALSSGAGEWRNGPPEGFQPSRSQIQHWIERGALTIDGSGARASDKPKAGALIELRLDPKRKLDLAPMNLPLEILYEDSDLVVVNKAQGLSVHPSESDPDPTLVHALLYHVKELSGVGGIERPGIVHRIDKQTSGVLVVSKNDRAHRALSELFAAHAIDRRYWALCYSQASRPLGAWKRVHTKIERNPNDRMKMRIGAQGRDAITEYRFVESFKAACLIEAKLHTGRTHQVRVHLTSEGHSLLGDPLYGQPTREQPKWKQLGADVQGQVARLRGQMLHARVLGFKHPTTGQDMHFEAEPPEAFRALLETLRSEGSR